MPEAERMFGGSFRNSYAHSLVSVIRTKDQPLSWFLALF